RLPTGVPAALPAGSWCVWAGATAARGRHRQDRGRQENRHMAARKPIESWLTDMDGVLIHEGVPIPGADAFIKKLRETGRPFLVLTNNSIYTRSEERRVGKEWKSSR